MLLVYTHVHNLNYFFSTFPYENLILLLRDGRDVVSSTIKTWPEITFSEACMRWNRSTKNIVEFIHFYSNESDKYLLARYEEIVKNPEIFINNVCDHFNLDNNKYPFEKINDIPVIGSSTIKRDGKVFWDKGVKKPKNFKSIGRWKNWSNKEKRIFKKIAGQTLIDTDYVDNNLW